MQSRDDREVNIGMNENQNDKQTKNFIISIIALIIAVNVSVLIFMAYISQMTDNIQKWADGEKSRLEEIKEPLEKALEEKEKQEKKNYEEALKLSIKELNEKIRKRRTIKSLLTGYCNDPIAIDLLTKLLIFNPNKRITVEEALEHPYVADFHNPSEEIASENKIRIPLDDTKKFSLQEYRQKLYEIVLQRKIEIRRQIMESMKKSKEGSGSNK